MHKIDELGNTMDKNERMQKEMEKIEKCTLVEGFGKRKMELGARLYTESHEEKDKQHFPRSHYFYKMESTEESRAYNTFA